MELKTIANEFDGIRNQWALAEASPCLFERQADRQRGKSTQHPWTFNLIHPRFHSPRTKRNYSRICISRQFRGRNKNSFLNRAPPKIKLSDPMQNRSQCNLLDTCIYLHYSLFLLLRRIHFLKPLNELEEHQQNRKKYLDQPTGWEWDTIWWCVTTMFQQVFCRELFHNQQPCSLDDRINFPSSSGTRSSNTAGLNFTRSSQRHQGSWKYNVGKYRDGF